MFTSSYNAVLSYVEPIAFLKTPGIRKKLRQLAICVVGLAIFAFSIAPAAYAQKKLLFHSVPTQFIAALGDPQASFGSGVENWAIWRKDPGPRGVWLKSYDKLAERGGISPAGWQQDNSDWWLDENGIIMEQPVFSVPPGKYLVTGDREVTTVLVVHPKTSDGKQFWELANGAKLYDVTHLPCRSARYTPLEGGESCTPANADQSQFPVTPGGLMPGVSGCAKQDYAVLFVIGIAVDQ